MVGPELWPHVVYVLNRGGRFQGYAQAYKDGQLANKYGKMVGIYYGEARHHQTFHDRKNLSASRRLHRGPPRLFGRNLEDEAQGYDMTLITYKSITQTKSRTGGNYWLQAVYPENLIEISVTDAKRLGLKDGDKVKVVSATNEEGAWDLGHGRMKPMIGKVRILEGIRPGVVAFSLGHGHWAYGAGDVVIDGVTVTADPRRATGVHANAAMRVDPV